MKRFKTGVDDLEGCLRYYKNRAYQLIPNGWSWDGNYKSFEWGTVVTFDYDSDHFSSVFIFKSHRNRGDLSRWHKSNPGLRYFTLDECGIESRLIDLGMPYVMAKPIHYEEYIKLDEKNRDVFDNIVTDFFMNSVNQVSYLLRKFNLGVELELSFYNQLINNQLTSLFSKEGELFIESLGPKFITISEVLKNKYLLSLDSKLIPNEIINDLVTDINSKCGLQKISGKAPSFN